MSNFSTWKVAGVLSFSAVVFAGCGGGSGGGSDGGTAAAPSAPVVITAANAPQVAGASYNSVVGLNGAGAGGGVLTGAVTQTGSGVDIGGVLVSVLGAAQPLIASGQFSGVTGVVVSGSDVCTNGGTFSFTLDDVDNNSTLSTGDTMSLAFVNCNEAGTILNGSIALTGLVVSGDIITSPYTLQFTMQMNNLAAQENGQTDVVSGSATYSESSTDGVVTTSALSGTSLQYTSGGVTATITAFQLDSTDNLANGAYTFDVSATVSSPAMGGKATIVTSTTFQGTGSGNPFVGQAKATGASNSSVTLTAIDAVNVRLEVDEDGDGVIDSTTVTTWAAL